MKKCPYCAEEIQNEAIKCRHCGESLTHREIQSGKTATPTGVSPQKAVAGLFGLAGIWMLIWGFSTWSGGHDTRGLYKGTALQGDAQVNQISDNFEDEGTNKMFIGGGLLLMSVIVGIPKRGNTSKK